MSRERLSYETQSLGGELSPDQKIARIRWVQRRLFEQNVSKEPITDRPVSSLKEILQGRLDYAAAELPLESVLRAVETAAQQNIPLEAQFERRHERKDTADGDAPAAASATPPPSPPPMSSEQAMHFTNTPASNARSATSTEDQPIEQAWQPASASAPTPVTTGAHQLFIAPVTNPGALNQQPVGVQAVDPRPQAAEKRAGMVGSNQKITAFQYLLAAIMMGLLALGLWLLVK